jgi:hypothetical protein
MSSITKTSSTETSGFQPTILKPASSEPGIIGPEAQQPAVVSDLSPTDTQKTTPLPNASFDPNTTTVTFSGTSPTTPLAKATPEQVAKAVSAAVQENYRQVPPRANENRHELNQRLQLTDPSRPHGPANPIHYDGSEVVVISFEGTGAFEPRRLEIMEQAAANLKEKGLQSDALFAPATEGIEDKTGKKANWSGLNAGVHSAILEDRELQEKTQILSFPSEESELFRGSEVMDSRGASYLIDAAKDNQSVKEKLSSEILGSLKGNTPGIDNAVVAMRDILAQAKAQGKTPKFVVVGHSSGGRSMVKFLEKVKDLKGPDGQNMKFDLAISIDPVREAHEAALEGARELLNKGTEHNVNRLIKGANFLNPFGSIPEKKVYPPVVGYHSQPESLYAPGNVAPGKYLSFYQRADTEGLGMGFGIHGSPVAGAKNTQVFNNAYGKPLGKQGHGEITYSPPVVNAFTEGVKGLLRLP